MTLSSSKATEIIDELKESFVLPDVDLNNAHYQKPSQLNNVLYEDINPPTINDLTEGIVGGAGAYDLLMTTHKAHLKEQYDQGSITGAQYSEAYIMLSREALNAAVQFTLGSDQARWQAILTQQQARAAEIEAVRVAVQLEIAKAQLAAQRNQAALLEAQHVLAQMEVANADGKYLVVQQQLELLKEQTETARAQTLDTRTDALPVDGVLGMQKLLYQEQISSYEKDARYKGAKLYSDAWITQKTVDENFPPPGEFSNTTVEVVLSNLRSSLALT